MGRGVCFFFNFWIFGSQAFIQSLCSKEIPERLARCINDMNLKKAANVTIASSVCDETSNPPVLAKSAPEVCLPIGQPIPLTCVNPSEFNFSQANIIQLSESGTPILVQVGGVPSSAEQLPAPTESYQDQNSQSATEFNFGDSNMGMDCANSFLDKFFIDNEDISLIAEQFSEPVFVTLLEDFASESKLFENKT